MDNSHSHNRPGAKRRRVEEIDEVTEGFPHDASAQPTVQLPLHMVQQSNPSFALLDNSWAAPSTSLMAHPPMPLPLDYSSFPFGFNDPSMPSNLLSFWPNLGGNQMSNTWPMDLAAGVAPEMGPLPPHQLLVSGASGWPPPQPSSDVSLLPNPDMHSPFMTALPMLPPASAFYTAPSGQGASVALGEVGTQTICDANQTITVCFGTITDIIGRCDALPELGRCFDIVVQASDKFDIPLGGSIRGKIKSEHGLVVQGLLEELSVMIYGTCILDQDPAKGKAAQGPKQVPCSLTLTVYGPLDMAKDIGEWAQGYDIYLQDPLACHMDVVYCNPHRLSSSSPSACPTLSNVVHHGRKPLQLQELPALPDILDTISSHIDLELAPAPSAVRAVLQKHQRQALTFMQRREAGWAFAEGHKDLWEFIESDQDCIFVNRVSGCSQTEEPTEFRGGIVADPMGLGKTLTMISLVASDLVTETMSIGDNDDTTAITLVVVPPPLLDTWESEISTHIWEGTLVCRRHHAKTRLSNRADLRGVNVVLTTYHTVSAEWRPPRPHQSSVLFSNRWRRIILDEAHFIRNGSSRMTRAVCDLDAVSRWAVTGTPIQNRLTDLATLLRFVRAFPYTDPKRFDTDISQLWKAGKGEEAAKRLALLSSCLLLRRPPNIISLPTRRDTLCSVEFTAPERALYTETSQRLITRIDEALHQGTELSRSTFYVNVLQQIESLRLICDLGTQYHTRKDTETAATLAPGENWINIAQRTFNVERDLGPLVCLQCGESLETAEGTFDDPFTAQKPTALLFSCLRYLCSECTSRLKPADRRPGCGHSPSCPLAEVSVSDTAREDVPDMGLSHPRIIEGAELPSKIAALVSDIKQLPPGTKSVVFSTWRMTLDAIERALHQENIGAVRFDGKVQQKDRKSVVERFERDGNVRVMLLTLSCGAVGLTLTVASRAYLMEPHWNPTLEDQALARIHRIGQTKEVTTVRFYIRDSFEEEIMKLQKKKKQLAGVLLSPHDGGNTSGSWDRLHELRRLL